MEKYIITNNFSRTYDTREETEREYNEILEQLPTFDEKFRFAILYRVAPFIIKDK